MVTSLLNILSDRAKHQSEQQAYIFLQNGETESGSLTYGELDRQARAIAAAIQSWRGERALLMYPPGLEFITAFFGCLYAGVIAVPVYPPRRNQNISRLQAIVFDSQATLALTTTTLLSDIENSWSQDSELALIRLLATDSIPSEQDSNCQQPIISSNDLAFLQYTSGSTGTPKGVMVSHANLLHNSNYIKQAFELISESVSVSWLPSFHDMGLIDGIIQPLYTGFLSILMAPTAFVQKPIRWLQAITHYRATHCGGPDFGYSHCVNKVTSDQRQLLDLSSWSSAYSGAEPVRRETLEQFTQMFEPHGFERRFFYPCYGMAETTLMVSGGLVKHKPVYCDVRADLFAENRVVKTDIDNHNIKQLVGSGRSWLDVKIVIVNPELQTRCDPDQIGEIWVSGASVTQGYWNRPEATKETFQAYLQDTGEGPFLRTGDLGFLDNEELFVTGRLKDVIIIRGRNHYPQDIELTVEKSHPALRKSCSAAFAVEIDEEERLIVLCEVERTHLRKLNFDEVVTAIKIAISTGHELDVQGIVLLKTGSISKTSSGKIQRQACKKAFLDGSLQIVPDTGIVSAFQAVTTSAQEIQFSLLYFSSDEAEFADNKYKLLLAGAKFADQHGFTAVWTPERHFHAFGGLYPNPSVVSAALALSTEHLRLRAGSVVMPLHDPLRVVEEWSVVDNLSHGRVDLAFARGWNPNDFVLAPDTYADSTEILFKRIAEVQHLWKGGKISRLNGVGKSTEVQIYPLPQQADLAVWVTCTGGKERFIEAGERGFNILTALLFQPVADLAEKIVLYREARARHGHNPITGQVTLMLHTFVGEDLNTVRHLVREPFIEYIKSSVNLWQQGSQDLAQLSLVEQQKLLDYAFERYYQSSALFGTPESCRGMVEKLQQIGVNEIACLIDFGIPAEIVLSHLQSLNRLKNLMNGEPAALLLPQKSATPVVSPSASWLQPVAPMLASPVVRTPMLTAIDQQALSATIVQYLAIALKQSPDCIAIDRSFHSFGIDSLKAVEVIAALESHMGIALSPTLLFEYSTPQELAAYLIEKSGEEPIASDPATPPPKTAPDGVADMDIAIIGMAGRFPQAANLSEFWELLRRGGNAITEVPTHRWQNADWYSAQPTTALQTSSRWGGFVNNVDRFDPLFFQISPREAALMDPQQRLFLEVAWEALEDAGYAADRLSQQPIGVFVGCGNNSYYRRIEPFLEASDYGAGIGNQNAIIANRLSFLLNLRGPSIVVDTMCSSSLVAVHLACQSIRQGDCMGAIAGGVNLQLSPEYYAGMSRMKMHSPDGQCKTFDAAANGIVLGEGAGAVLLKPLAQAVADGDQIYGTIKGSAINHDGHTNGLTAPNPRSQAELIERALQSAQLSAADISYIEAHGTGTALGDPIEIEGLTKAFRKYTSEQQFCRIGSVKTNIGHLEAAAGIAQLLKVLLAMKHGQLPPSLHFNQANPLIPFAETPFTVNTQLTNWSGVQYAGVSSFGIGGTNAHLILGTPPKRVREKAVELPLHVLNLSAKNPEALHELVDRYHQLLTHQPDLSLADLCFTANTGRVQFNERLGIVTDSISDLTAQLTTYRQQQLTPNIYRGSSQKKSTAKIAYLFTGQGSLSERMGHQLYETQPTFRQAIAECAVLMEPHLDQPLLSILYPVNGQNELINRTIYVQPALFAFEYALFKLWQSWGITPDALLGHSLGEYVAAVVAGVMSLADGIKLVTTRARLIQNLPVAGEMVAVFAPPAEIQKVIKIDGQQLTFAVYNSPENTVIAGDKQAISRACATLAAEGIGFKLLNTTNAFHSPLMEPILPEFQQLAATISYTSPQIPLISNLTGVQVNKIDAEYWCQHLWQSVRFADGIQALAQLEIDIFLEIGPKPTLLAIGQQCLPVDEGRLWLSSLRGIADGTQMLHSLAQLAVNGVKIDWSGFDSDYARQRIPLPTYPFQRKSYWIDTPIDTAPLASIPSNQNLSFTSQDSVPASVDMTNQQRQQDILNQLHTSVVKLLKADLAEVDVNAPFLEMGADSLLLVEAIGYVERTFGLKIGIRQIFEELTTIALLAKYIHEQIPLEITSPEPVLATSTNGNSSRSAESNKLSSTSEITQSTGAVTMNSASGLERIMQQQLQIVSNTMSDIVAQQLSVLREQTGNFEPAPNATKETGVKHQPFVSTVNEDRKYPLSPPKVSDRSPLKSTEQLSSSTDLDRFINSYTQKTFGSKNATQISRDVLADSRASAGFRPSIKELVYPIIGARAAGAHFWDIDGNKYIDISMGFGVLLFGHNPQFVKDAISAQMERGLQIGPQAQLAGEVARSIVELTGTERVAFCNSGTEAVMTAIRLARHTTGRNKIVIFTNSYHGHFDGILATASQGQSIPSTTGIAPLTVSDVLVLEYGEDSALEILRANATEIAAVIVEPVQSRNPSLQPREFLQQLRQATADSGIALVFDEVLLGFRIHQGGAQAWFDIKADLITYGKIIGGGLPIGVVAGCKEYLDGIDGGSWSYGNASYPSTEKTFFAGTFNKNHLGMAAAHAVLQHLKAVGPSLQTELNQRTLQLVSTLNNFFISEEVPIKVINFGSLFRFTFSGNFDQFFYHLIAKGIYIWEGRACFLSTAHTDEDVNQIVQAIEATVREMRNDGFWTRSSSSQQQATTVSSTATVQVEQADEIVCIPLTKAQQQLWFLVQLGNNSSAAYNESVIIQLRGELKLAAMQQALQKIVDRHEALRTRIDLAGEVQHICPSVKIDVPVIDFSRVNGDEQESQLADWLQEDSQTPFDFTQNSLFRCRILKLESQQHLLVISAHHIITDGWSMGIMLQEIAAIYSAECENTSSQLTSPLQFRSYAQWLEQQAETAAMASHQSYWLEQLYAPLPVLELPTDRPRRATKTFRASRQTIQLEPNLSKDLRRVSREQGCTLFMTMLSAYKTLLHRLTGQADILIGISTAGRSLEGNQKLIGYCTHLLPIRSQFVDDPSFLEYLQMLRGILLDAYEHQDYPFANLLERLSEQRKTNHSPLITAIFNLEPYLAAPKMFGLDASLYSGQIGFADYDLDLNITEIDTEFVLNCDYSTDLFDAATISRMLGHFQALLSAIVENPQQAVSKLPLLSESERHQLLVEWNDTQSNDPLDQCFPQLFEAQVAQTPDAIAVVCGDKQLTYQELNVRANRWAHQLVDRGVKAENLVALLCDRNIDFLTAMLAVFKAGGAYLPLNPDHPAERIRQVLAQSQVSLVLSSSSYHTQIENPATAQIILLEDLNQQAEYSSDNLPVNCTPNNLAYVIYTSGSTGTPKGAMLEHRGMLNHLYAKVRDLQLTSADVVAQTATQTFDISIWQFLVALLVGGRVEIVSQEVAVEPVQLLSLVDRQQISILEIVPSLLRVMLQQLLSLTPQSSSLTAMRWLILTGEALPPQLCREWFSLYPTIPMMNAYGPTECSDDVTHYPLTQPPAAEVLNLAIGRPVANTQLYILDPQLQPLPVGVAGELYVGGMGVGRGYLNNAQLTQIAFIPNPFNHHTTSTCLYKTGDLARYLPDGNIEFLGRIDHQVKIRGFRIELGEIEAVLSNHPQIQQAVAIATEDATGNQRLVTYVVSEEEKLSSQQLREFLQQQLPIYMVPSTFVILDTLPLTPNGKVDRKALLVTDVDIEREHEYVAPQTPNQEIIAHIFATVLGIETISIHDNFFELGGHSLLATQLTSRLKQSFTVDILLRAVFEAPTVAQLDLTINQLRTEEQGWSLPAITRIAPESESIPLSFAQERLWFLNQLEGASATYNMPAALRLTGELNLDAFDRSLAEIVRRHESLRTSFLTIDGTPQQMIHSSAKMGIEVIDLQHLSDDEQKLIVEQQIQQSAITPFDLEIAPLIRCGLLQLSGTDYVFCINMHHIVSDGWSIGVFVQELSALYPAFCNGNPSPLPELAIQYADFAVWQRQWLQDETLDRQLSYWQQQLQGVPELLQLPTDRPRPSVQTYRGTTQSSSLSTELTQSLQALSRQMGSTLFMILMAAFTTLLYRYSGESDVVIGSPIANRNRSEIESLIGFFVNTLVLRSRLEDNPSFEQLIKQVRETTLKAYEHQDVPFEQVVEALQPQRSMSYSPLFQVMFDLENMPMGEIELPGVKLSELNQASTVSKFDLTLSMTETPLGLDCDWEYNTDLFDKSTIERMASHFENLLTAIVKNPHQLVGDLPLLSSPERQQLLVDWNDTQADYPQDKCIHQLFEEQSAKTPDAVAVVFEEQELTYRQLNQRANQLAHHLQTLGVKPEVLVGICVERSLEMVVGLLGILKAGGAYVPLDPSYPAERLSYMLSDAGIEVLLTQENLLSVLPSHTARVVRLDIDLEVIEQYSQANLVTGAADDLAYIIYTSGSTGQPKGVLVAHQSLVNAYFAWEEAYRLQTHARNHLQMASLSFDVFGGNLVRALCSGGKLVVCPLDYLLNAEKLYELMVQQEIDCAEFVPAVARNLMEYLEETHQDLSFMKVTIVGSDNWYIEEHERIRKLCHEKTHLINSYGVTEATVDSCYFDNNYGREWVEKLVPIGKPFANTQVYILDSQLQPVPIGVAGELHIGGDGLARGYLNRPELTQAKFIPNPFSSEKSARLYKTGDLARYLPDGNIEFLGRIDHQVKIRGFRIELGEIEAVLSNHPHVRQAVAIVTTDLAGNQRLIAYVVSEAAELSTQQLREFLHQQIPAYMMPSTFIILNTLPLTPNGKVDRKALPAPDGEIERTQEYVAPQTQIEQILTTIWQELLLREPVSIHDNFFEIGGDSILSIQVVSRAKTAGVQITPKQLFQHQTIAGLARVANTTQMIDARQGLVTGSAPLTPIQHVFWAHNLIDPHHYNQSVLLQTPADLSSEFIATACQKLLEHHDALRLRFPTSATEHQQINHGLDETVPFTIIDLSSTPIPGQPQALKQIATSVQASLNLSTGPIMQIVMFDLGHQQEGRLLIVIHHLAVDGVSWRILLSDLETIYQQLTSQQPIQLSQKTTAFIDWAEKLARYAQSERLKLELDYWLKHPWEQATPIPLDLTSQTADNTIGSTATVSITLSALETHKLLGVVHDAHNTQINDLLLTGLALTLAEWTGNFTTIIDLEGHGREELFEDVDLSRTVGWFTSLFPVLLQLPPSTQPATAIKSIKEQLRAIPQRGVGYGILRYLCTDAGFKEQLQSIPTPEISFNYLGQFDQIQSDTGWKFAHEVTGQEQSPLQQREHTLELNCLVMGGELQINWNYSSQIHHRNTIEDLAQSYLKNIRDLIDHCQSTEVGGFTPSDFPEADLNQTDLDLLLSKINTL